MKNLSGRRALSLALLSLLPSALGCGGADHPDIAHASATVAVPPATPVCAAGAFSPAVPPAKRGAAPIVLAGRHAPLGGIWLPNGHLLLATTAELLDIDPAHPNDPWRVIPSERDLFAIAGVRGGAGDRFVVYDRNGASIWDATTLAPLQKLPVALSTFDLLDSFVRLPFAFSDDGRRLAVLNNLDNSLSSSNTQIFDAHTLALIATIPGLDTDPDAPLAVDLGADGSLVAVVGNGSATVTNVATNKVLVTRALPRTASRGTGPSVDVCEIRGKRILITSGEGFESFDVATGKRLLRSVDPRLVNAQDAMVSADGTKIVTGAFQWDVAHGGKITKVDKPHSDVIAVDHMSSLPHTLPRADGHFSIVADSGGIVVNDASEKAVLRFGMDLPNGFETFRNLDVFGGVARRWATLASMMGAHDAVFAHAATPRAVTFTFRAGATPGSHEVIEIDQGTSKELFHVATPSGGAPVLTGNEDDVALIAVDGILVRCASSGCTPTKAKYEGSVLRFADPWTLQRGAGEPVLVNLDTGDERPTPAICKQHQIILGSPLPALFCNDDNAHWTRVDSDGPHLLPVPGAAPPHEGAADFVARSGDQLYFDVGRTSRSVELAFRYDSRRGTYAQMYSLDESAVVQFDDGMIERFGDDADTARLLRCPVGATWASFATCRAQWSAPRGRFEKGAE